MNAFPNVLLITRPAPARTRQRRYPPSPTAARNITNAKSPKMVSPHDTNEEGESRGSLICRTAKEPQHGADDEGAAGYPSKEEVQKDVPGPSRRDDEMLAWHQGCVSPRRRKAISPATAATTAVTAAPRYPGMLLRLGSTALSVLGRL